MPLNPPLPRPYAGNWDVNQGTQVMRQMATLGLLQACGPRLSACLAGSQTQSTALADLRHALARPPRAFAAPAAPPSLPRARFSGMDGRSEPGEGRHSVTQRSPPLLLPPELAGAFCLLLAVR